MPSQENEDLHDAHARLLALAMASEVPGEPEFDPGSPPAPPIAEVFGPYRLSATLGHGGQGVVYRALDTRLGREVALKLLSARGASTATTRARFEREAAAISRLRHPGICTVYEAGEIDGQRYLSMELLDGQSLTEWAGAGRVGDSESGAERRTRVSRALEIVENIARAVHAAHESGVVHRDLKPANVMLRGEGSPVVLDFGLARDEGDSGADLTMPGDVLGTPAYMPPERVRGVRSPSDPREDVYSLGVILYECLTGRRPFEGHTREQLYRRILTDAAPDPRRANAAVPREARFVVETAMDKVPDRRYASALEFADDVSRLRCREPIRARPVPMWQRALSWVQRDPRVAIPILGAAGVLIAGIAIAMLLLARVRAESSHTRIRALVAESSKEVDRDPQRALLLVREADRQLESGAPPDVQAAVRSAQIEALAAARRISEFEHDGFVLGASFSSDGRRMAVVTVGKDAPSLRIYRIDGWEALHEHAIPGPRSAVMACSFDEARERVLLVANSGLVQVLSMHDASLLHEMVHAGRFGHARLYAQFPLAGRLADFVPGRPDLVVTGAYNGLRLWRLGDGAVQELWHDPCPERGVHQIAISPDGRLCASGGFNGILRVVEIDGGRVVGAARASDTAVRRLTFDPHRPLLLSTAVDDQGVVVWRVDGASVSAGEAPPELPRQARLPLPGTWAYSAEFAPSRLDRDPCLVVLDFNRRVRFYDSVDGQGCYALRAMVVGDLNFTSTAFSPDGGRVALSSGRMSVEVFDLSGSRIDSLRGSIVGPIVDWSPDGSRLVSSGFDRVTTALWRMRDPVFRVERLPRAPSVLSVAGSRIAAGLFDGSIAVIDRDGSPPQIARGTVQVPKASFTLSPDGQRLAVGGNRGRYDLWDLSGERPVLQPKPAGLDFNGRGIAGNALQFQADGGLLIAVPPALRLLRPDGVIETISDLPALDRFNNDHAVICVGDRIATVGKKHSFWDSRRGIVDEEGAMRFEGRMVRPVVSADGTTLAVCERGAGVGRLKFLDLDNRRLLRELDLGPATDPGLSRDGSRIVMPGRDGRCQLWDLTVDPPQLVTEFRGHSGTVWGACFLPGDEQIISAGSDGTVRFWPARLDGLGDMVEERLIRDWTDVEKVLYAGLIEESAVAANSR